MGIGKLDGQNNWGNNQGVQAPQIQYDAPKVDWSIFARAAENAANIKSQAIGKAVDTVMTGVQTGINAGLKREEMDSADARAASGNAMELEKVRLQQADKAAATKAETENLALGAAYVHDHLEAVNNGNWAKVQQIENKWNNMPQQSLIAQAMARKNFSDDMKRVDEGIKGFAKLNYTNVRNKYGSSFMQGDQINPDALKELAPESINGAATFEKDLQAEQQKQQAEQAKIMGTQLENQQKIYENLSIKETGAKLGTNKVGGDGDNVSARVAAINESRGVVQSPTSANNLFVVDNKQGRVKTTAEMSSEQQKSVIAGFKAQNPPATFFRTQVQGTNSPVNNVFRPDGTMRLSSTLAALGMKSQDDVQLASTIGNDVLDLTVNNLSLKGTEGVKNDIWAKYSGTKGSLSDALASKDANVKKSAQLFNLILNTPPGAISTKQINEYYNQAVAGAGETNFSTNKNVLFAATQAAMLLKLPGTVNSLLRVSKSYNSDSTWNDMYNSQAIQMNAQLGAFGGSSTEMGKSTKLIANFEGFRSTPYWDVNAHRAGFGSDTITLPDGTVKKVTPSTVVSKGDAQRDLERRTSEFQRKASSQVGEMWGAFSPDAHAALTSVAYNYGSLPSSVVKAAKTGDKTALASAIAALSGHDKGINRGRRLKEADIVRGS